MTLQTERSEFTVKTSIFDRPRSLTLDPEYLEFDDNDQASSIPTRFLKNNIEAFRYGVKGIRGYKFYIGRVYCIDIKSSSGQVIKIRLKSIYRIRRKLLAEKYVNIVHALFHYYFNAITRRNVELFRENGSLEILGVNINTDGVLFDKKVGRISWNFLGTKRYQRYYTLFSETDPNQYKAFVYLDQWNAAVLHSTIETILKWKFPQKKF
ncbi:MAG: hypothetical protein ABUL46_03050 [Chitinophaga rupis]